MNPRAGTTVFLRACAAAGLSIDAYVHAHLAGQYDLVTATVSEGALFRIEAGAAVLAALLVLAWQHWIGDLFAWATAAAGIAAIVVYRFADIGAFGPLPDMYEPIWSTDKLWALAGQILALVALSFLLIGQRRTRQSA